MSMTRLWSFLESLFRETEYHGYKKGEAPKPPKAKSPEQYKDDLLRYATLHYSEHEADQIMTNIQRLSPQSLQRYLDQQYSDPGMNAIVKKMIDVAVAAHPDRAGTSKASLRSRPEYPTSSASTDKGSGDAEPIPTRPDRKDVDSPLYSKPSKPVAPGEKPVHAVGSAGQHRPKDQTSLAQGVKPLKMEPGQTLSGLVAAQKEVDRITKRGEQARADALARRLGVPTTADRTNDDGKVVVWSPDRVLRFMDPDRNPDAAAKRKDAASKDEPISRMDLIKHGIVKRNAAGIIKPNFKGTVIGQRWKPHGQSYVKNTARPDQATGNFAYGKALVDPSKTGQEVVWDGEDWIPADDFKVGSKDVARRAWRASQHPPTRGKHSGGTPVLSTSPESVPRHLRPNAKPAPEPNDDFDDEDPTDPDINA